MSIQVILVYDGNDFTIDSWLEEAFKAGFEAAYGMQCDDDGIEIAEHCWQVTKKKDWSWYIGNGNTIEEAWDKFKSCVILHNAMNLNSCDKRPRAKANCQQ